MKAIGFGLDTVAMSVGTQPFTSVGGSVWIPQRAGDKMTHYCQTSLNSCTSLDQEAYTADIPTPTAASLRVARSSFDLVPLLTKSQAHTPGFTTRRVLHARIWNLCVDNFRLYRLTAARSARNTSTAVLCHAWLSPCAWPSHTRQFTMRALTRVD